HRLRLFVGARPGRRSSGNLPYSCAEISRRFPFASWTKYLLDVPRERANCTICVPTGNAIVKVASSIGLFTETSFVRPERASRSLPVSPNEVVTQAETVQRVSSFGAYSIVCLNVATPFTVKTN